MSIIEVKNLGKKYTIGEKAGYVALRDSINSVLTWPLRALKGQHAPKNESRDFWALSDINFTVEKGEVLGVIGKNGAGKSTLLKILSRITPPTTGEITLRGRVGSLLEVGTGFHPELSGRENVYLNGSILGMRKKEIDKKFEEIVAFAGIEKFLDTPVKRYSSGMYVRLAFAVAAHLEPDIMIFDEVLAVGDVEFQKKCLGKMEEVTKKDGRTVIFVSHNMGAVRNLCTRTMLLADGHIKSIGPTEQVVSEYLALGAHSGSAISDRQHIKGDGSARVERVALTGHENAAQGSLLIGEPLELTVNYTIKSADKELSFFVLIADSDGKVIVSSFQKDGGLITPVVGEHAIKIGFDSLSLLPGRYSISVGIFKHDRLHNFDFADWVDQAIDVEIAQSFYNGNSFDHRLGVVNQNATWNSIL